MKIATFPNSNWHLIKAMLLAGCEVTVLALNPDRHPWNRTQGSFMGPPSTIGEVPELPRVQCDMLWDEYGKPREWLRRVRDEIE